MSSSLIHPPSADTTAAWAVGIGIGLIVLMITWLVGSRLLGLVLDAPEGPTAAFLAAVLAGAITAIVAGRRLASKANV